MTSGRAALDLLPPGDERFRTAVAVLGGLLSLGRIEEAIAVADEQVRSPGVPAALRAQRAMLLVFANRTEEALREATLASSMLPSERHTAIPRSPRNRSQASAISQSPRLPARGHIRKASTPVGGSRDCRNKVIPAMPVAEGQP